MTKKKMKSARDYLIHVRVSKMDYAALNKQAKDTGVSRSKVVARMISKGLGSESDHPNLFQ